MFNFYIENNFCTDYNVYINPAYMKNDPFEKTNYWPIRILQFYPKLSNVVCTIKFMSI